MEAGSDVNSVTLSVERHRVLVKTCLVEGLVLLLLVVMIVLVFLVLPLKWNGNDRDKQLEGHAFRRSTAALSTQFTTGQFEMLTTLRKRAIRANLDPEEVRQSFDTYDQTLCYSTECLNSALELMEGLNFSVDPCNPEMWLDFACSTRNLPPDNGTVGPWRLGEFIQLSYETDTQFNRFPWNSDNSSITKFFLYDEALNFQRQCEAKGSTNEDLNGSVVDIVTMLEAFGSKWPAFNNNTGDESIRDNFRLLDFIAEMNRYDFLSPFLLKMSMNSKGEFQLKLTVSELPSAFYIFPRSAHFYDKHLEKIGHILGVRTSAHEAPFQFYETLQDRLQKRIARKNISSDRIPRLTATLKELQEETDNYYKTTGQTRSLIDWVQFFSVFFRGSTLLDKIDQIRIGVPSHTLASIFEAVDMVREQLDDPTRSRVVVNALYYDFAVSLLWRTTSLYQDTLSRTPGNEKCAYITNDIFGPAFRHTVFEKKADRTAVKEASTLVQTLVEVGYNKLFEEYVWVENRTTNVTRKRLSSLELVLGQPDSVNGPEGLHQFYNGLNTSNFEANSYSKKFLSAYAWYRMKKLSLLHRVLSRNEKNARLEYIWSRDVGLSAYSPHLNVLRLDTDILRPPMYSSKRPGFMNYAGFGFLVGHEIGHMFDTDDRQYDEYGSYGAVWDINNMQSYNAWVKSIADFYSINQLHLRKADPSPSVSGGGWRKEFLDDDIADNIGLLLAYTAYEQYLNDLELYKGQGELRLPGFTRLDSRQLFFIKYSKFFCSDDVYASMVFGGPKHSNPNRRATLPLLLSKDFRNAFQCQAVKV